MCLNVQFNGSRILLFSLLIIPLKLYFGFSWLWVLLPILSPVVVMLYILIFITFGEE